MVKNYLSLIRIPHWIKNLFVFIPVLFSKNLFDKEHFQIVLLAFITFCVASSLVYIINDIFDIKSDKIHPAKRYRPLASGKISIRSALTVILILSVLLVLLLSQFNYKFILVVSAYVLLNFFYSIYLKNIVIVDIICIASGFMLRVIGGGFVIDVYISSWLILTTLFVSLFLAVMKRRSELVAQKAESETRKVLDDYSLDFINQISSISAAGVIVCYALYSVSARTVEYFHSEHLIYTTIFVVFGIFRYMFLVYKRSKGENTVEILLSDIPMIINLGLYILTIVLIIYF